MVQIAVFLFITLIAAVVVFFGGIGMLAYTLPKSMAKFGASSAPTRSTTSGSVQPTGWSITNSKNMPPQMTANPDGSYYFDFPVGASAGSVHYVVKPAGNLPAGQTVTMEFNVTGSGQVVPVQGMPPAKVSLFMQRRGDNLSAAGPYQQYRYWHSSAPLSGGDGSLSAALNPDQWTDVYGKSGSEFPTQFAECLANAEMIGFTFGDPGAGATGHGAFAYNGSARFTLKSFSVS